MDGNEESTVIAEHTEGTPVEQESESVQLSSASMGNTAAVPEQATDPVLVDEPVANDLPSAESVTAPNAVTNEPIAVPPAEIQETKQQEPPVVVHQTVVQQEPPHMREERMARERIRLNQDPAAVQKEAKKMLDLTPKEVKRRELHAQRKSEWQNDINNPKHYDIGKPLGIPIYDDAFIFNYMADYMVNDLKNLGVGFESWKNPYYDPGYRALVALGFDRFIY